MITRIKMVLGLKDIVFSFEVIGVSKDGYYLNNLKILTEPRTSSFLQISLRKRGINNFANI